jgi:septum formation protein
MTRPLLLASTSRYRRELLERLGVPFDVAAPDFDERALEHRFDELDDESFALLLAEGKAGSAAAARPGHTVLAADQVLATVDPRALLHKPGTKEKAVDQLMVLRGRTHRLVTGVVLHEPPDRWAREVDVHRITMRNYERAEVEAYVDEFAPVDCVGSYRVEDAGIRLFERVEGRDPTGIIGLPLLAVCRLLRSFGVIA